MCTGDEPLSKGLMDSCSRCAVPGGSLLMPGYRGDYLLDFISLLIDDLKTGAYGVLRWTTPF